MGRSPALLWRTPVSLWLRSIGCATLVGIIFTIAYAFNLLIDVFVGQRVSAEAELEGLDRLRWGRLGYQSSTRHAWYWTFREAQ